MVKIDRLKIKEELDYKRIIDVIDVNVSYYIHLYVRCELKFKVDPDFQFYEIELKMKEQILK